MPHCFLATVVWLCGPLWGAVESNRREVRVCQSCRSLKWNREDLGFPALPHAGQTAGS
jgi:hypothetical protein